MTLTRLVLILAAVALVLFIVTGFDISVVRK